MYQVACTLFLHEIVRQMFSVLHINSKISLDSTNTQLLNKKSVKVQKLIGRDKKNYIIFYFLSCVKLI